MTAVHGTRLCDLREELMTHNFNWRSGEDAPGKAVLRGGEIRREIASQRDDV